MNISGAISSMSSKEISALTGKQHAHVLRDIRAMLNEIDDPNLDHKEYQQLTDERGYASEILLNKRLTYILLTGYSVVMRARVIDRWEQLEQANTAPALTDPALVAIMRSLVEIDQAKQLAIAANDEAIRANKRLDQIETATAYFTIVGWVNCKGRSVPQETASAMGRKAANYCRDHGIALGSTSHPMYGAVKTYPKHVLDHLFSESVAV